MIETLLSVLRMHLRKARKELRVSKISFPVYLSSSPPNFKSLCPEAIYRQDSLLWKENIEKPPTAYKTNIRYTSMFDSLLRSETARSTSYRRYA